MIKLCGLYALMIFFQFLIKLLRYIYFVQNINVRGTLEFKRKKKLANAESLSSNALGWIVLDQIFELDLVLIMVLDLK